MHSPTCVSVVVCVVHKPRPCLSYSRRRDRINLVLLRSYYKGGGSCRYTQHCTAAVLQPLVESCHFLILEEFNLAILCVVLQGASHKLFVFWVTYVPQFTQREVLAKVRD